jgi:alginate O-acetyltransferase complex protein AlgI
VIFNSLEFAVFVVAMFLLYWQTRGAVRRSLLLAGSYLFYGWWDWRFLSLIVISTLADFVIARRLEASDDPRRRTGLLLTSVTINLGILSIFKYFDFFVSSFHSFASAFGLAVNPPLLEVLLPVGISFYTFQTISYTFDVHRGRLPAERSLLTFAVYVAYFPQLVAGPIERARHLLPQLQSDRPPPTADAVVSAVALIATGLFKKVVIADGIAPLVNRYFADPDQYGSIALVFGVYAFALQIYGDFSGYSSIARGVSRLLGVELVRNFEQPYLSRSITEFWRTWHISLSNWLHDYLYVPLGGNRGGRILTYRNLMLTMLLGGLWHGAAWTFVVWGGLHGLFLAVHRAFGAYVPRGRPGAPRPADWWRVVGTFHLVCFAWIFFRADGFSQALDYVGGIIALRGVGPDDQLLGTVAMVLIFALVVFAMDLFDRRRAELVLRPQAAPRLVGATVGVVAAGLLVFSGAEQIPFIYFQF